MFDHIVFDYHNVILNPLTQTIAVKVVEIINDIYDSDIPLTLFTNTSKSSVESLNNEYPFLQYFINTIYNTHYPKPSKESFQTLVTILNTQPQKILFIDDDIHNIEVANQLEITTIHYQNPNQLKQELTNLGIKLN